MIGGDDQKGQGSGSLANAHAGQHGKHRRAPQDQVKTKPNRGIMVSVLIDRLEAAKLSTGALSYAGIIQNCVAKLPVLNFFLALRLARISSSRSQHRHEALEETFYDVYFLHHLA